MLRTIEPTEDQKKLGSLLSSIVLASSSPNRKKLLENSGLSVTTFTPNADESTEGLSTEEAMLKNARVKMEAYLNSPSFRSDTVAVSADTLVEIDGTLLGKPKDRDNAREMLFHLSGRTQKVYTGCSVYLPQKGETITFSDTAEVVFHTLTPEDIESYLATGEWQGAAGAYRLQKTGYTLVDKIDGDWATVVGLPIKRIIELLQPKSSS